MANSAISVTALRVVRGGREVVKEIGFETPRGRITGLLGLA
ncbi:hypothetical protein ACFQ05_38560 [Amycolatopsis umgeniensis]|uniref:ABC-type multidrug transport system ATPase subunit n=1 Tax=Amycolatopsis umgeniensis TaxID=336628 RepID=A0A841AUC7_9PSEU|nr:ABC-type multidrug transport system ATPase subunit [Amycolatopsis umgeniensis]